MSGQELYAPVEVKFTNSCPARGPTRPPERSTIPPLPTARGVDSGRATRKNRTPRGPSEHACGEDRLEAIPAQEAILRRARGRAASHASGKNFASQSIEWV